MFSELTVFFESGGEYFLAFGFLIVFLFSIILFSCVFVLLLLALSIRGDRLYFPGFILAVSDRLESVVSVLVSFFGLGSDWLAMRLVDVRNRINRKGFMEAEFGDRILFLPQCIRHRDCPAHTDYDGLHCTGCGLCSIKEIQAEAKRLGYRVYIAPGSSLVSRKTKLHKPKAALGLGCLFEIKEFMELMARLNVHGQGVILSSAGCVETTYSVDRLLKSLRLGSVS